MQASPDSDPGTHCLSRPGVSKKRLFETIASIISEDQLSLPSHEMFWLT